MVGLQLSRKVRAQNATFSIRHFLEQEHVIDKYAALSVSSAMLLSEVPGSSPLQSASWYAPTFGFYALFHANIFQSEKAFRTERDTFGELRVPADRYWGAQTQRYDRYYIGICCKL